ncbi:hypothetical protein HMPREF1871_00735 [Gemelliphila asaccharolytica]|uniref:Uncharacterized protein n=1 Tax=Gemelliphila asaccharolytica TaxID=502393 RepID=A0ABR5TLN1_9BACL|nr:hypothetical protein HMPREF1871_00735 [Gemella asaccharolytica]
MLPSFFSDNDYQCNYTINSSILKAFLTNIFKKNVKKTRELMGYFSLVINYFLFLFIK